jgi:hypothetical protein
MIKMKIENLVKFEIKNNFSKKSKIIKIFEMFINFFI